MKEWHPIIENAELIKYVKELDCEIYLMTMKPKLIVSARYSI
jgi:hypothetical protein